MKNEKVNKNIDNLKFGYILMFITVIIWGLDNALFKDVLNTVPTNISIYIRFIVSIIVMQTILSIKKEYKSDNNINKQYYKYSLFMSIFISVYYIISMNGLRISKAIVTEFIGTGITTFSTIIILAIFIKEERKVFLNKNTIIALIIALIGAYFTSVRIGNIKVDLGAILVIISTFFWGLYTMVYMKIDKRISVIRVNRDINIIPIIIFSIILICTGEINSIFELKCSDIIKTIMVSLLIDVGTIVTYYKAIRIISGTKASILSLLSPIISFGMSYFYLGERIDNIQFLGCTLLFLSSILLTFKEYKEMKEKSK